MGFFDKKNQNTSEQKVIENFYNEIIRLITTLNELKKLEKLIANGPTTFTPTSYFIIQKIMDRDRTLNYQVNLLAGETEKPLLFLTIATAYDTIISQLPEDHQNDAFKLQNMLAKVQLNSEDKDISRFATQCSIIRAGKLMEQRCQSTQPTETHQQPQTPAPKSKNGFNHTFKSFSQFVGRFFSATFSCSFVGEDTKPKQEHRNRIK